MSKVTKRVYDARSTYPDRTKSEQTTFTELNVAIKTLKTALLLLDSLEEAVLLTVLNHLTIFARKQFENVLELKENNMLDLLLVKGFYIDSENLLIRRFALYILTALYENSELQEFESEKTAAVLETCFRFYMNEFDDFCIEYLTCVINICLRDPQMGQLVLDNIEFLSKFKSILKSSDNPDTVFNSIEAVHKLLQVQTAEELLEFSTQPDFPIDRIICELTSDFPEIRMAALKVMKILLADTSDESAFGPQHRCIFVLHQLTKAFCDDPLNPDALEIIDVLATALRSEKMTKLFFEQNLFEKVVGILNEDIEIYSSEIKCKIISLFAEAAKYSKFLLRMHCAGITQIFIDCLMKNEPAPAAHVILGLNRMICNSEAQHKIVEAFEIGLIAKLLSILHSPEINIKTREQAAELVGRLLTSAFHETAQQLLDLQLTTVLANTLQQGLPTVSIDLILSLLTIIERLANNDEYREELAKSTILIEQVAQLLMKSYAHSILVNNIFRCLCTIIDEEPVREVLLENFIVSSIKRALKSLSNLVKTAVTNFILQTTRFNEYLDAYVDRGILEVMMMYQKHAFCVSTWGPAIDSILSKCPTMKFAIRNFLGFTDITANKDFFISKRKFEDFRDFQTILRMDCSPLETIIVVNFERVQPNEDDIIDVELMGEEVWTYCKRPGDEFLPQFLENLNNTLAAQGLVENPEKIRRSIDFDNVAKRSKIIAETVESIMNNDLKILDLNTTEECSRHAVKCHLTELRVKYHTNFIPIGVIRTGCQFERAVLFKCFADQIGLPATLQRSVDGRMLYNEVPLPLEIEKDIHCDEKTMKFMPWRMLRPTHIVDLMYNVGELYPMQSRQALQYLRLY